MSHSQHNVGRLLIKLKFTYFIKVLYFFIVPKKILHIFSIISVDLFIFISSLGYLRHIEDELFVKIIKTNFNHILYYLQNISP